MEIKNVKSAVENFVPPVEFGGFFSEWKKEQARLGFNWSANSEELFRQCMVTGMVYIDSVDSKEEVLTTEKVEASVEEKRTRARVKPEEKRTRARVKPEEKRTRTRTLIFN